MHLLQAGQHLARIAQQRLARAGELHAAGLPLEQGGVERILQPAQPVAGR